MEGQSASICCARMANSPSACETSIKEFMQIRKFVEELRNYDVSDKSESCSYTYTRSYTHTSEIGKCSHVTIHLISSFVEPCKKPIHFVKTCLEDTLFSLPQRRGLPSSTQQSTFRTYYNSFQTLDNLVRFLRKTLRNERTGGSFRVASSECSRV